MKILHVLNHSVPHTDGYCIRSANIVRFQAELGLTQVVVTSPHQEPVPTEACETIDGTRYYRIVPGGPTSPPVLHEWQAIRRLRRRIEEVARMERPDVIHAHSPCLWGYAARRAATRLRLPFVYEVRGIWEDAAVDQGRLRATGWRYRTSRALETWVARRADAMVTISRGLRGEFEQRGISHAKLFLVPNGVSVTDFSTPDPGDLRQRLGLQDRIGIGYIGSLYAWEGVDDLLRCVGQVIAQQPRARFVIVGRGPQESELRRLSDVLKLDEHVLFVGGVPHREVAQFYAVLDILVYPRRSTRNTELVTPLKPLEAMAMGKAVLASDVAGLKELFSSHAGVLHRAGDPRDLAQKCLELLGDPNKRAGLGRAAQAEVSENRDWCKLAANYVDAYRRAADEARPGRR